MCVVSMVSSDWQNNRWPTIQPQQWPNPLLNTYPGGLVPEISRQEFDTLKQEIEELKKLLVAAKAYDKATGQPDCEMDSKVALIKGIANALGVDLGNVFE